MKRTIAYVAVCCGWMGASAQGATSTFDTTLEGWLKSAASDVGSTVTWADPGGNPGGHAIFNDAQQGNVDYFFAPAQFLGDQSVAYNTNLQYDINHVSANPIRLRPDVILDGGGFTLVYFGADPTPVFTTMSVPLLATAPGWHLEHLGGLSPTPFQFQSVLANLSSLRIRADYTSSDDTTRLDNVFLFPEPSAVGFLVVLLLFSGSRRISIKHS